MNYKSIPGYFDFEGYYSEVVVTAPTDSILIEVGCWLGKSTIYLAEVVKASGKDIRIFAVDTWRWQHNPEDLAGKPFGYIYHQFLANIRACGVNDIITPLCLPSVEAAKYFEDSSAFMVYIDAEHTYEAVRNDIAAWRKKIRPGGMLAGHDYTYADKVKQAVDETWPNGVRLIGPTWVVTSDKL